MFSIRLSINDNEITFLYALKCTNYDPSMKLWSSWMRRRDSNFGRLVNRTREQRATTRLSRYFSSSSFSRTASLNSSIFMSSMTSSSMSESLKLAYYKIKIIFTIRSSIALRSCCSALIIIKQLYQKQTKSIYCIVQRDNNFYAFIRL